MTQLKENPSSYLNIDEIVEKIDTFAKEVEDQNHISDNCVLVVGGTGCGKSTLMNILAGKEMTVMKIKGLRRIDVANEDYAGVITLPGFEKMSIGHGRHSKTQFPNYIEVDHVRYWDCPGTKDERGPNIDIPNAFYVHKILSVATRQKMQGVKFIFVQDYFGLHVEGGRSFYDHLEVLCKILGAEDNGDFDKLIEATIDATVFVFNKMDEWVMPVPEDPKKEFMDNVLELINTSMSFEDIDQLPIGKKAAVKFVKRMLARSSDIKFVALPRVSNNSQCLTDAILNSKYGLAKKVASLSPMKNFVPKIAVGFKSTDAVFSILQNYNEMIENELKLFGKELQEKLKASGTRSAQKIIFQMWPLIEGRRQPDHGDDTKEFLYFLDQFLLLNIDGVLKTTQRLQGVLKKIHFTDKIMRSTRAGADLKSLINLIVMACIKYLTQAIHDRESQKNKQRDWSGLIAADGFFAKVKCLKNKKEQEVVVLKDPLRTEGSLSVSKGHSKPNEDDKEEMDVEELNKLLENLNMLLKNTSMSSNKICDEYSARQHNYWWTLFY